jgi:sensor domain CHASE-containing protein
LEEQDALLDVARVVLALAERRANLEATVQDWAYWDSTYAFAQDRNEAFIKENLTAEALATLRIDMLAIVDGAGRMIWGGALPPRNPSERQTAEDFERLYGNFTDVPASHGEKNARSGVLLRGDLPLLVAYAPILTSQNQGPGRGTIIMGQKLGGDKVEELASLLKMNPSIFRADREE